MRDDAPGAAEITTDEDRGREARRWRLARRLAFGAGLLLILVLALGAWNTYDQHRQAETTLAHVNEPPTVRTMVASPKDQPRTLSLSGTMEPYDVATIYARATGYVAKRNVDFGSRVKTGDVLAVIAAPDLDQQLAQAKAQLVQTEASLNQSQAVARLQTATNARTQKLVAEGWQTKQQGDTDRLTLEADLAAVKVAQANLESQKANLLRLQQLTDFEKVRAPFDGVVTDRQIDVGSLVTADANSGTSMFTLQRSDVLRVQVYVPQDSVFGIHDGDEARVTVPEISSRDFKGRVSRTADALQAGTRTLLTQVDVENAKGELRAGLYCKVSFTETAGASSIVVPSQAVIFNSNGLSVAVVQDGKAHIHPIELYQDNGADVEVRTGLSPGDRIILSPPVNLSEGMPVKVAQDQDKGGEPKPSTGSS